MIVEKIPYFYGLARVERLMVLIRSKVFEFNGICWIFIVFLGTKDSRFLLGRAGPFWPNQTTERKNSSFEHGISIIHFTVRAHT